MGVYIKGMEMPTSCFDTVLLCNDGRVFMYKNGGWVKSGAAVPVPPHGRLIDADALPTYDKPIGKMMMFGGEYVYTQTAIDNAPTIIEAEEGEI